MNMRTAAFETQSRRPRDARNRAAIEAMFTMRPARCRFTVPRRGLGGVTVPSSVHVEDAVQSVSAMPITGPRLVARADDAGRVHQHVEPAPSFDHAVDGARGLRLIGHVDLKHARLAASPLIVVATAAVPRLSGRTAHAIALRLNASAVARPMPSRPVTAATLPLSAMSSPPRSARARPAQVRDQLVWKVHGHPVGACVNDLPHQLLGAHAPRADDEALRVQALHELRRDGVRSGAELGQPHRARIGDDGVGDLADQPAGRKLRRVASRLCEPVPLERGDGHAGLDMPWVRTRSTVRSDRPPERPLISTWMCARPW